jgi:tetratricopeptide (TPR) repeat protein
LRLSRSGRAYGELLLALKDPLSAIGPGETAVNASRPLLSVNPRNIAWRVEVAAAHLAAGSAHRLTALHHTEPKVHLARAAALLERALELNRETAQMDPMSGSAQDSLIVTSHRLARVRENQQRYAEALALYGDARAIIQKRLTRDATRRNLYLMGNNMLNAAGAHLLAGQRREAAAAYEESSRWLRQTLAKEPTDAVAQEHLFSVFLGQAKMAEQDQHAGRARELWKSAWEEAQKMIRRDDRAKSYLSDYASLEAMGHRLGELPAAR